MIEENSPLLEANTQQASGDKKRIAGQSANGVEGRRHNIQREEITTQGDRRSSSDRSQVKSTDSIEDSTLEANTQLTSRVTERVQNNGVKDRGHNEQRERTSSNNDRRTSSDRSQATAKRTIDAETQELPTKKKKKKKRKKRMSKDERRMRRNELCRQANKAKRFDKKEA